MALFFAHLSCSNNKGCVKIGLSLEDKDWFKIYMKNELFLFKSNLNNMDTIKVAFPIQPDYTVCNKFELGGYQYEENVVVLKSVNCHGLESEFCDIRMHFSKSLQLKTDIDCLKSFSVFDLNTDLLKTLSEYQDSVELKYLNKKLNCYTFNYSKRNVSDWNEGIHTLKEFNWSKEYGLVRYELDSGEVYELISWK